MSKTSEVLNAAADYIEEHGWIQGQYGEFVEGSAIEAPYYPPGCRVCLTGAINLVTDGSPCLPGSMGVGNSELNAAAYQAVRQALEVRGKITARESVMTWNDAEGRTQAEVVALLRRVAREV